MDLLDARASAIEQFRDQARAGPEHRVDGDAEPRPADAIEIDLAPESREVAGIGSKRVIASESAGASFRFVGSARIAGTRASISATISGLALPP